MIIKMSLYRIPVEEDFLIIKWRSLSLILILSTETGDS